jgi:hypothetical protein
LQVAFNCVAEGYDVQKKDWCYGYSKLNEGMPREKRPEKKRREEKPGKSTTEEKR